MNLPSLAQSRRADQLRLTAQVLCVLQYLTPLIIISWVYSRMAHRLWGSRAPGNAEDSRDATLLKNKKKVGGLKAVPCAACSQHGCSFSTKYSLLQMLSKLVQFHLLSEVQSPCLEINPSRV